MRIESERLVIRSLRAADEQTFVEMASDNSLCEIFGDCSGCHTWMGNWIQESMKLEAINDPYQEYLAFAIEEKEHDRVIGSVGTSYYEDFNRIGITYFIGADFRGLGYMAEAVRIFAEFFFKIMMRIRFLPESISKIRLLAGH
ncbi:MAG: GNAT family N-acetyltransferase [Roseburia sp.]|nr:GNAT family N-acetyltransferase [Roseburia sp.]